MIQCANCLHAVPEDVDTCPWCQADLREVELDEIDETFEWRIVREVSSEIEARLIAGRLQADGIPAVVLSQVDTTRNFTVGALAIAKVFVPEHLFAQADLLLQLPVSPNPPFGNGHPEPFASGSDD